MKFARNVLLALSLLGSGLVPSLSLTAHEPCIEGQDVKKNLDISIYYTSFDASKIRFRVAVITPDHKVITSNELYYFDQIETVTIPAAPKGVYTIIAYVTDYKEGTHQQGEFGRMNASQKIGELSTYVLPFERVYSQGEQIAFQYLVF